MQPDCTHAGGTQALCMRIAERQIGLKQVTTVSVLPGVSRYSSKYDLKSQDSAVPSAAAFTHAFTRLPLVSNG